MSTRYLAELVDSAGDATVVAVQATATANALAPTIPNTGVSAPQATATADALVPALQTDSSTTIGATQATATAAALTPSVPATIVVPAPAAATGDANAPAVKVTVVEPIATATAAANAPSTVRTIAAPQAAATATANTPFVTASCVPYVHDVITTTATAATTVSLDMATLDITGQHSNVVVLLVANTTTSIAFPTVTGAAEDAFVWWEGHGPGPSGQTQMLFGTFYVPPVDGGMLTFTWSGAHDVIAVAYCVEAGGCHVYFEDTQSGGLSDHTFNAFAYGGLDGGEQLLLANWATNTATLSTVTPPTGFPDNTYGPYTSNSSVTLLSIDSTPGPLLDYDMDTWTLSDDTVQGNGAGILLAFSAFEPPANDDLADAIDFGGTGSGSATGTYTGTWLEDITEYDESNWWNGITSWFTFTNRGGAWTIEVDGAASLTYDFGYSNFYAGAYFALYEADVGETDPSTIYAGWVDPDAETFSGGFYDDLNYSATFNSLDATKQYWVQVDTTQFPVTHGDYAISWTQVPTIVVAPMATATAAANTPSISSGSGLSIAAPQSTATAAALVPTITATSNVTRVAPMATAVAMAFGESGVSGGDGLVIGGGTGDDGMTARWVIDLAASDG